MPRNYITVKTESYDKKDLELAILLIREDGYQVSTVRDRYGIPEQTIRDHLKREAKKSNKIISDDSEKKIPRVLKKLAEAGHIRTWTNVRERVFEMLKSTDSVVPETWKSAKKTSWDWLYSFRERHQLKLDFQKGTIIEAPMCPAFECNCGSNLFQKNLFLCEKCMIWSCKSCFAEISCKDCFDKNQLFDL